MQKLLAHGQFFAYDLRMSKMSTLHYHATEVMGLKQDELGFYRLEGDVFKTREYVTLDEIVRDIELAHYYAQEEFYAAQQPENIEEA